MCYRQLVVEMGTAVQILAKYSCVFPLAPSLDFGAHAGWEIESLTQFDFVCWPLWLQYAVLSTNWQPVSVCGSQTKTKTDKHTFHCFYVNFACVLNICKHIMVGYLFKIWQSEDLTRSPAV